jgi:hypothetical protein
MAEAIGFWVEDRLVDRERYFRSPEAIIAAMTLLQHRSALKGFSVSGEEAEHIAMPAVERLHGARGFHEGSVKSEPMFNAD